MKNNILNIQEAHRIPNKIEMANKNQLGKS